MDFFVAFVNFILAHALIFIVLGLLIRLAFAILDYRRYGSWRGRRRRKHSRPYNRRGRYTPARQPFSKSYPAAIAPQMLLESPIETLFWDCWQQRNNGLVLVPQYEVDRYHLDFAHVPSKVGIELDGFVGHSSTEDIARDRRRQRELEMQGWRFIRFGGKEINNDPLRCVCEAEVFIQQVMMGQQQRY